ncbi:MAG: hypothetical protein ACE5F1_22465 [Planctomycetota bacterium]
MGAPARASLCARCRTSASSSCLWRRISFGLPNDPSLAGLVFHAAGLTLDNKDGVSAISSRVQLGVFR